MEAKFYEIFSWRTGDFAFKEGKGAPDEPVHLERAPAALILEGIRRHYDPERVRSVLASFAGQYVAPSRDPLRRLQDITADAGERRFIESLDGSLRLEAALSASPVPIQRARLLLVAMSEAGHDRALAQQAHERGQAAEPGGHARLPGRAEGARGAGRGLRDHARADALPGAGGGDRRLGGRGRRRLRGAGPASTTPTSSAPAPTTCARWR
jgi:hypothetical protein